MIRQDDQTIKLGEMLKKFRCRKGRCKKTVKVRAASIDGHSGHMYLINVGELKGEKE